MSCCDAWRLSISRIIPLICILLLHSISLFSSPPARAEIFAPGSISLPERIEFCLALSPDGDDAYFAVRTSPQHWQIHQTHKIDGLWQPSVPTYFSGPFSDLEPTFSPDGQRLFFASNRPLEGSENAPDFNLWVVDSLMDKRSVPRPLPAPINGPGDQWRASQSLSGRLYFSSMGLWSCPYDGQRAGKALRLFDPRSPGPLIGGHAFVAPDERYLLTAWMNGPGGRGGWDLYVSFRTPEGTWGPSINLGDAVNSPDGEDFPLISADGRTLYFFRHRKDEHGESGDIYHISVDALKVLR